MRLRDILVPVLILGFALPALAGDAGPRPWKTIRDPRAPIPSPPSRAVLARGDRFEIATPDNAAVAEISVKIVSDRDGRIVNGRIFRAAVPASAVDAPNAARALDEALSVVMLDIVRWVSGSHLPRREDPNTAMSEPRPPA